MIGPGPYPEMVYCNDCGSIPFILSNEDSGDAQCRICGSDDIEPVGENAGTSKNTTGDSTER